MSEQWDESDSLANTFRVKLPSFAIGVVFGMLIVWVALKLMPYALGPAIAVLQQWATSQG